MFRQGMSPTELGGIPTGSDRNPSESAEFRSDPDGTRRNSVGVFFDCRFRRIPTDSDRIRSESIDFRSDPLGVHRLPPDSVLASGVICLKNGLFNLKKTPRRSSTIPTDSVSDPTGLLVGVQNRSKSHFELRRNHFDSDRIQLDLEIITILEKKTPTGVSSESK